MKKEEIAEIARIAAVEAVAAKKDIIEEEFDARYHDVELLMKNYRKLKVHYDQVSSEVLEVNAICNLHTSTGLMMSHVDKMLAAYKAVCMKSPNPDDMRRWDALYLRYIDPDRISVDEIAATLSIDKRTFYRDIGRALEDMAVLLFGITAIGSWKHKRGKGAC